MFLICNLIKMYGMKQISRVGTLCILLAFSRLAMAQCAVVSGTSGTIKNSASTASVTYSVAVYGSCVVANNGSLSLCGFDFPAIQAPYTGIAFATGTVVYTFSSPVSMVDLFIAAAGVTATYVAVEGFTFNTNGSIPQLSVNSGSCIPWTVTGNEIVSPQAQNAFNAVVSISSAIPFTTLSIANGAAGFVHGGSAYGLCETSLVTGIQPSMAAPDQFHIYPLAGSGQLVIEGEVPIRSVELYNGLGKQIYCGQVNTLGTTLNLEPLPTGMYIVRFYSEQQTVTKKIFLP
jgi:hypothetical protein